MVALRVSFLIILGGLCFASWSCVDVPTSGQLPPDYHALARFVNLATDAAGGAVTVDGTTAGTLNFGDNTDYIDFLAGGRSMGFAGDQQSVDLRSNSQNTVIVMALAGGNRFLKLDEGYSFANNFQGAGGTGQVMFVHVGQGSAPTISFRDSAALGPDLKADVPYAKAVGYTDVPAGTHTIYAVSTGGYTANLNGANTVPTPVVTASTGTATCALSLENGLEYSVEVVSSNAGGVDNAIYLAAHFHVGGPTVNGPVVHPIDISAQAINFPDANLTGANWVPTDTATKAGGTASGMVLTSNAARDTFALSFTVAVLADTNLPGPAGDFLTAGFWDASGQVRSIALGPYRDTTITDVWSTGDAEPLTRALVDSLLKGKISIRFKLTAGGIRANLAPEAFSTNTYTGQWADISDADKDSVVAGSIYVNFHTTANPAGQIRGQLMVDSTKGQYGVAADSNVTITAGRTYTMVAYGAGPTLALKMISDRQFGITKTSVGTKAAAVRQPAAIPSKGR